MNVCCLGGWTKFVALLASNQVMLPVSAARLALAAPLGATRDPGPNERLSWQNVDLDPVRGAEANKRQLAVLVGSVPLAVRDRRVAA